jgi:hypothetical protein
MMRWQMIKQVEALTHGEQARSREHESKVTLPPNLPALPLQTASDLTDLLAETLQYLLRGEMDCPSARAIAHQASLLLRALKQGAGQIAMPLAEAINRFRRQEIPIRIAKSVSYVAAVMLGTHREAVLEKQPAAGGTAGRQSNIGNLPILAPAL